MQSDCPATASYMSAPGGGTVAGGSAQPPVGKKKNGAGASQGSMLIHAINRHTSCWRATPSPTPPPCHAPSCRPPGRPPNFQGTGEPREFPPLTSPLGCNSDRNRVRGHFPQGPASIFARLRRKWPDSNLGPSDGRRAP